MEFEKRIEFYPAFDRRDPDPKKNYGIHGVEIVFSLIGASGFVCLTIFTPWFLDSVDTTVWPKTSLRFSAAEVQFHSRERVTDFQTEANDCSILGGKCYWDGSGLASKGYFRVLRESGSDGLWNALEEYYFRRFPLDGSTVVEDQDILVEPHETFNEIISKLGAMFSGGTPEEFFEQMESQTPEIERSTDDQN